ncbi:DUF488 domain-containing protein [Ollibium composti]|uniref:DUF488 domain-containing protein n=1 Tax=Ollibium composti TaxID=2675109 RepID=A0ABY2QAG6_9HYPH|nr:DUF488 domain-containing protein [Mesorhizobium composti]THF58977.1 DUF488 domain-containing protein [Mesorhizobium composti]
MAFDIAVKRVYEPAEASDGQRVLVDRLWPRGVSKEKAELTLWLKGIAPSNELRHWYNHDPERWEEFRRRYAKELDGNPEPLRELGALLEHGRVTLLYSTQEERYNNAVALVAYLKENE